MGGNAGLTWPDFEAFGLPAHTSLGFGPIYRGRPEEAHVLILADQQPMNKLGSYQYSANDDG